MANQQAATPPPPSSPRAPKIQQQSWDDCGSPPIDLFDPNKRDISPPLSPLAFGFVPPRSPKGTRKLPVVQHHDSAPSTSSSFCGVGPKRLVRKFDSTHSEPAVTGDYSSPTSSSMAGGQGAHKGRIQTHHTGSLGEQRSPNATTTTTFVFDEVVTPKYEKRNTFEIYENLNRDESFPVKSTRKRLINRGNMMRRNIDRRSTASDDEPQEELHSFRHPSQKRNSVVAESIISCESEVSTTSTFVCSNPSEVSHVLPATGAASAATSTTVDLSRSRTPPNESDEDNVPLKSKQQQQRRHAINITSNPGYQAIHKSHHALDRTCSDSLVTRRRSCRKSTSDLTSAKDDDDHESLPLKAIPSAQTPIQRRRGSSKGGLAYLASRRDRGSRDSIKSNASNASVFSNEDIGPLAFQASERGRQRRTSNFLELPVPDHIRPRVCSLPERPYNPRQSDDLYRLRTFSISKGTVVNCGDSIISRRSRSNTSVNSTASRASERSPSCCGGYTAVDSMPPSPTDSEAPAPRYRVVMLGDASVGKTALVSQFMTSEYMHTYDASLDDEFGEKSVSVLLDGEESEMVFIDHPSTEMSVENSLSTYEPHCCVVVYSVVARNSFRVAEEIINYLWRENITKEKSVIVVGNKADLARARVISTVEGKALAQSRDAKFIETSSGIQHNVDELLVGVLKQVRLKETRDKKAAISATKMRNSRTHISLHMAKEILQKICLSDISKSKSCENLHVL